MKEKIKQQRTEIDSKTTYNVIIRTTYRDLDGKKQVVATKCSLNQNNLYKNDYFTDINIRKGIILTRYVEETKRILTDAQQNSRFKPTQDVKNDFTKAMDEIQLGKLEFAVFKFGYPLIPKLLYSHDDDTKLYENWEKEVFPKLLATLSRNELLIIIIGFKYINENTKMNENKLLVGSIIGKDARLKAKMLYASTARTMKHEFRFFVEWDQDEFKYSKLLEQARVCTNTFQPIPKIKPKEEDNKNKVEMLEKREIIFAKWLRKVCEKDTELDTFPEQFDLLVNKYHQLDNN